MLRSRIIVATLLGCAPLAACDFCSVASVADARERRPGWNVGLAERFTHYGTLQEEGERIADPAHQRLDSSVTQFSVGYRFPGRIGLKAVAPYIHRSFRRAEGFAIDDGTEAGLGDISLIATVNVIQALAADTTWLIDLVGGVKLPTGDSDRLGEEADEVEIPGAPERGVHGHDLALGSGSTDGLIGMVGFARCRRFVVALDAQYAIRTRGAHRYRYADDLIWSVAPGWLVLLDAAASVAIHANLSGEHKGKDEHDGEAADDTAMSAVYLGPMLSATLSDRLSADCGVDLPLHQDNSAVQLVSDWRIHGAATMRF